MADYDSSLPVRTQNDGDVVSKIGDGTTPSQYLAVDASGRIVVKLDDGSGNALTSQANGGQQALDVGINVGGVQIDPRDIRALTSSDVVTANQGAPNTNTNGWFVKVTDGTNNASLTAAGELKVDVTQPLPAGTNSIGTVKAQLQDNAGTAITLGQKVMASSVPVVIASDQSPIGVYLTDNPGTTINDYNTASAVAAAASSNHDYPAGGASFDFNEIHASASGKMKVEIQVETASGSGIFNTFFVGFNSTANPNVDIDIKNSISVPTGANVRVIRTNLDIASQDLYSTISGLQL